MHKTIDKFNYLFIPSSQPFIHCWIHIYLYLCMPLYVCMHVSVMYARYFNCCSSGHIVWTAIVLHIYCDLYIVDVNVCSVLFVYVFVIVRYCLFCFVFFE